MTLPIEKTYSIENTREFLRSLLDPKKTPRVPREIRRQAGWCLKHFPSKFDMSLAQERTPAIWGRKDKK